MTVLTKQKLNLLAFLISVLCVPTMYASQGKQEDEREVELVATKEKMGAAKKFIGLFQKNKFKVSRKCAMQSGLIADMLALHQEAPVSVKTSTGKQDDLSSEALAKEEEIPSIPLPNISSQELKNIITLMEESCKYKDDKGAKEKLAEFIEKEKWDINKVVDLLFAANYLNAQLILKALAYEIANYKINEEVLKILIPEMLFEIQAQYILRFNKLPIHIFDDKIIEDLKKKKLYQKVLEIMWPGKFVVIFYDDKGKIGIGEDTVEISKYLPDFKGFDYYLVSGSNNGTVKLWNVSTGKFKTFPGTKRISVTSVAFSPNGKYIAAGSSYDKAVRLWKVSTGKLEKILQGHVDHVNSVAFSPDGKYIASGSDDGTVKLWNVKKGKREKTFRHESSEVYSVAFSPDGKYIAAGVRKAIMIWNVSTSKLEKPIKKGVEKWAKSVAFSPNGKLLAAASDDEVIMIWNVSTSKLEKKLVFSHSICLVAFSPNGELLASVPLGRGDVDILFWNVNTGKLEKEIMKKTRGGFRETFSVAFSPDGKYLAAGARDNTIKILNVSTGELKKTLNLHHEKNEPINSVAFSPV